MYSSGGGGFAVPLARMCIDLSFQKYHDHVDPEITGKWMQEIGRYSIII